MFNVTVLKMKDIKKYLIGTIIFILLIISLTKYFSTIKQKSQVIKQEVEKQVDNISAQKFMGCLEQTMPVVASINEENSDIVKENDIKEEKNIFQEILKTQISSIKGLEISEEQQKVNEQDIEIAENKEDINSEQTEQTSEAKTRTKNRSYNK